MRHNAVAKFIFVNGFACLNFRLIHPCRTICFDGVPIADLDNAWLRRNVSIVGQEPILFARSIFRNIVFGLPEDPGEGWCQLLCNSLCATWICHGDKNAIFCIYLYRLKERRCHQSSRSAFTGRQSLQTHTTLS